jgi:hypothetical protein
MTNGRIKFLPAEINLFEHFPLYEFFFLTLRKEIRQLSNLRSFCQKGFPPAGSYTPVRANPLNFVVVALRRALRTVTLSPPYAVNT